MAVAVQIPAQHIDTALQHGPHFIKEDGYEGQQCLGHNIIRQDLSAICRAADRYQLTIIKCIVLLPITPNAALR